MDSAAGGQLWGIVLAAGEGLRLAPFTRALHGDDLPKQFASLCGDRTFLQRTMDRIAPLFPPCRTVVVVGDAREQLAHDQLHGYEGVTIVAQPADRGTGPGILLPLAHVRSREPSAAVVIFPSDHHVRRPGVFLDAVSRAVVSSESSPSGVALVGATADSAATNLGWILPDPGKSSRAGRPLPVKAFVEKPQATLAKELLASGGLWNTLVVAGHAEAMSRLLARHMPSQSLEFDRYRARIGRADERSALDDVYGRLEPADFSRAVLQRARGLAVVPMMGAGWSDCGTPE